MREDLLRFLKGASDALWKGRDATGALICPKHRLDHTGKTCYGILIDLALFDATKEPSFLERAVRRGDFLFSRIKEHPVRKGNWLVLPGSLGNRNMSNTIIDSGAGVDALSTLLMHPSVALPKEKRLAWQEAIKKICDNGLAEDVRKKEIPNQRLWGGTGIAAAARLLKNKSWKETALAGIEKTMDEMRGDGFFPYHPYAESFDLPKGAQGITPFYHSRHISFILYILEMTDTPPARYQDKLVRALDALLSLIAPIGRKPLLLESKRWYWHGHYEVASFPFDIYALIKGWKITGDIRYRDHALLLLSGLLKHQTNKGFLEATLERVENFQCSIFWTAHTAWLARLEDELKELPPVPEISFIPWRKIGAGDVLKIETGNWSIIIRQKTEPVTVNWGAGVGGAQLISVCGRLNNQWQEYIDNNHTDAWGGTAEGNWIFLPLHFGFVHYLKSFWRANKKELWRGLYYLRVEIEAGKLRAAWHLIVAHYLKTLAAVILRPFATQWGDAQLLEETKNVYRFRVRPSNREKNMAPEAFLERTYTIMPEVIKIQDRVLTETPMRRLVWRKISSATAISIREGNARPDQKTGLWFSAKNYKIKKREIVFFPRETKQEIIVSYEIKRAGSELTSI